MSFIEKPANRGDWMMAYSGRQIYPLHPEPDDIEIRDIAHALSNMCRFCGHVREFYPVAQHLVLGAHQAEKEYDASPDEALEVLLHDASEAFLSDIVRPAKINLPDYIRMECGLERAITSKFRLPYPMSEIVKVIDNRMLVTEASQLLGPNAIRWWEDKTNPNYAEPYDIIIDPWTPAHARIAFLATYDRLVEARGY